MDIKDFIKTTLVQTSEAINESSKALGKNVKLTNTPLRTKGQGNYGLIEFDLAVEARNTDKTGKSGGVSISVVEAKLGKDKETVSSTTSRIKFVIEANL